MNPESSSSLHVIPGGPRIPWQEDDEDPLIRVKVVNDDPAPSANAFVHSPLQNGARLPPVPVLDDHLSSNGLPVDFPTQAQLDTNAQVTLDEDLDTKEPDIDPKVLQNGEFKAVLSDSDPQDTNSRDNYDYSLGLIDDYAATSTTPPPIPPSSSQPDSIDQQVAVLRLLTSRLAEAKARIDALAEEKLHMVQTHRQEVLIMSANLS